MRSKAEKADKKTAVSVEPSATTKKRGRPAMTPEQKAAAKLARDAAKGADSETKATKAPKKLKLAPEPVGSEPAPTPAKTAKAAKAPRAKKAVAPKQSDWDVTFAKIAQLINLGAVHVKVDGVEIAIPVTGIASGMGREYHESDYEDERQEDGTMEASVSQLAKVAPMDNPDEYAEAQDRWANHEPLPRI